MGQSLFFPQQAAPATSSHASVPDSGKESPQPKTKTPSTDKAVIPGSPGAPITPHPIPAQRSLTAFPPSPAKEHISSVAGPQPSTSWDKIKECANVWETGPGEVPLSFHPRKEGWGTSVGAKVGEMLKAPSPSCTTPTPREQQWRSAQRESTFTSLSALSPLPVLPLVESTPQSGDSERSKNTVPIIKMPFSFPPPEKAQTPILSRLQFDKELTHFQPTPTPQPQAIVHKVISTEERPLKTIVVNNDTKAFKTPTPTKSVSQVLTSPVLAKSASLVTDSGCSLERVSPSKSIKEKPFTMAPKPAGAQVTPLPPPLTPTLPPPLNNQSSFQLIISPESTAHGSQSSSSTKQAFRMSVAQKDACRSLSNAKRVRRIKCMRKRQNEIAAERCQNAPQGGAGARGLEANQNAETQTAETTKSPLRTSPQLQIQGASPVFNAPSLCPAPTPPALFTFSPGLQKVGATSPSENPKGSVISTNVKQAQGQLDLSVGPGQSKLSFSPFSASSSSKPTKLGATSCNKTFLPLIQEVTPGGQSCLPTTTADTNTLTPADQVPISLKVRKSPITPLKAKRRLNLKTAVVLTTAQPPGTGLKKEGEEKKEQAASIAPAPQPSVQTPIPPNDPKCPHKSTVTPAKSKKKISFKIPLEVVKSKKSGSESKAWKKEKKHRSKEAIHAYPQSPPSPESVHRPSGIWPPFTAEQSCSLKARCRHQNNTKLPRNVMQWLNTKPNYLCEPPWVTTATLAASVALVLRQDGTYTQH